MHVGSVKRVANSDGSISSEEIALHAVSSDSAENKEWSKWTPSGQLSFTVTNPGAFERILPGKTVYVDIVKIKED
jgi:hypothetical protein